MGESTAVSAARNVTYLWLQNLVAAIVRIVSFIFFVRLISVAQMGVFTILSLANGGAVTIAGLGLSSVVTKLVAENVARGKKDVAASVYYKSLLLSELASMIAAAGFLLSDFPAGISKIPHSPLITIIGILFVIDVLGFIGPTQGAVFFGLHDFRNYALINGTYAVLRSIMTVLFVYVIHSLVGVVVSWIISDWGIWTYMFMYLWRKLGSPVFHFSTRYLLKLSIPLYLASISLFLYSSFDQLTLIPLGSLTALGIYGAAIAAFNAYYLLLGLLGTVFLSVISKEHGVKGSNVLSDMIGHASRYISILAMPLAFGLLAIARPALSLLVGTSYEGGAIPLAVLALGSTATIIATPLMPVLIVLDETMLAALTSIIPIPIGVAVAFLIIPGLGILGASVARALSMILSLALCWYFLKRKINVKFNFPVVRNSVLASICMALAMQAAQLFHYNRFLLPAYVLIGLLTYILVMRKLKEIDASDLELLHRMLGPRSDRFRGVLSWLLISR